jgi:hypothetical protein
MRRPDQGIGQGAAEGTLAALDADANSTNESPTDLPDSLKREIVERVARAPMAALSGIRAGPAAPAAGRVVSLAGRRHPRGNGSNELIQATLPSRSSRDVVVAGTDLRCIVC